MENFLLVVLNVVLVGITIIRGKHLLTKLRGEKNVD
jgi:hypothetical protein